MHKQELIRAEMKFIETVNVAMDLCLLKNYQKHCVKKIIKTNE